MCIYTGLLYTQHAHWSYNRTEALTCHGDAIPKEEIWVKFGVDKGGGSFKMSFQVYLTSVYVCMHACVYVHARVCVAHVLASYLGCLLVTLEFV